MSLVTETPHSLRHVLLADWRETVTKKNVEQAARMRSSRRVPAHTGTGLLF